MSHIVSLKYYSNRTIFLVLLILFGFVSSRAIISIGTGLLAFNLLISFKEHQWQFFSRKKTAILIPAIVFLAASLFLFWSPDFKTSVNQLYYRLPWLVIPISVASIDKLETKIVHSILAYFILIVSVSGLIVLGNYFLNYEFYTEQIKLAKNIPTPLNHIRYSLMVAFTAVCSLYFAIRNNMKLSPWDRFFFSSTAIFLSILLHILSVRSGLLCYYLSVGALVVYLTWLYGKWWIIPTAVVLIVSALSAAYFTVPSLQNKVAYMRYDLQQLKQGNIGHNSDGRRWRSLLIAKELIADKPILGYGLGQVESVSKSYYQTRYPEVEEYNQKVPHNQFLYSGVEMGVTGVILILLLFLAPYLFITMSQHPLFIFLSLIVLSSCLVENTMESQVGMSFYLIFSSLILNRSKDE